MPEIKRVEIVFLLLSEVSVNFKRYGDALCQHQGRENGCKGWLQGPAGDHDGDSDSDGDTACKNEEREDAKDVFRDLMLMRKTKL